MEGRRALLSATRYEWPILDFAILSVGALTVPIYETSSAEQVRHVLSDSGAVLVFAETDAHAEKVDALKAFGAEVTAVCSTRNVDLVKSIGADHVIDYTKEDFTKTDQRYDMIYDLVGNHGFSERRQILKPNGICVLAGIGGAGAHPETMGRIVGNFWNAFRSNFSKEKFVFYIAKLTKGDFGVLRDLMQSARADPIGPLFVFLDLLECQT